MPRLKQRTPELRNHILTVAVETLAVDGVGRFTTRRIAEHAETSVPAIYELFGDKSGLVREIFFEGFRRLQADYEALDPTDDPIADLLASLHAFRSFAQANSVLFEVMYARPFSDFDPGPDEADVGRATREFLVDRVERCLEAGRLQGDATDIAHGLLALTSGLAAQELAGWMGQSEASVDRRWTVALTAFTDGLRTDRRRP